MDRKGLAQPKASPTVPASLPVESYAGQAIMSIARNRWRVNTTDHRGGRHILDGGSLSDTPSLPPRLPAGFTVTSWLNQASCIRPKRSRLNAAGRSVQLVPPIHQAYTCISLESITCAVCEGVCRPRIPGGAFAQSRRATALVRTGHLRRMRRTRPGLTQKGLPQALSRATPSP